MHFGLAESHQIEQRSADLFGNTSKAGWHKKFIINVILKYHSRGNRNLLPGNTMPDEEE